MKTFLIRLLLTLSLFTSASNACSVVQRIAFGSADWSSGSTGTTFNFAAPATAGNLIVVTNHVGIFSRTTDAVDDDGTTTYAERIEQVGAVGTASMWWGIAVGSPQAITITLSGNTGDGGSVVLEEFTGCATDQSAAPAFSAEFASVTVATTGDIEPTSGDNAITAWMLRTNGDWTDDSDPAASFNYLTVNGNSFYADFVDAPDPTVFAWSSVDPETSFILAVAWIGEGGGSAVPIIWRKMQCSKVGC